MASAPGESGAELVPLFGHSDVAPETVPAAAQDPGVPLRYRLMALGGASGLGGDGLHAYGGLEGGVLYRRVGLMALGQYGTGNEFTSLLLAGGPAIEGALITPFILRGVNLLGIDSVMRPYADRVEAWGRIARDLPMEKLEAMVKTATLADLPELGRAILKGQVRGRVVVDVRA